ncbi:hypothetical protein RND81_07G062700 [Saponaria officinalis]|uniref:Uncharacterized protein n=1 Tax=Saponaria officinalis TaxID=3572 RepID=A0AAW1JKP5_SAPOF
MEIFLLTCFTNLNAAKYLKLPFIDAYLNKEGNFTHGVNFATGGATALNMSVLELKYNISVLDLSLSGQLDWFKSHIYSYYVDESVWRGKISKGLFIMGPIGGNDYNFAIAQGKTLSDIYKMVPDVIQAIEIFVEEIIGLGATKIAIPGNFPVGCVPLYLSLFKTNDSNMYDELKCLKPYNKHGQFHNYQLQKVVVKLQKRYPNVSIVYMDYYEAFRQILQHATLFGFDKTTTQEACCGPSDEEYNIKGVVSCGNKGVPVCENPREHISWDGTHLTQHAYHVLVKHLMPSLNVGVKNERLNGYLISISVCFILIRGL